MRSDEVIINPIVSEKSNISRSLESKKYTFKVDPRANKFEIMNAVKDLFKVTPVSCNVINMAGKPKYTRGHGGNIKGYTSSWKKAMVTLKKGDVIQSLESV